MVDFEEQGAIWWLFLSQNHFPYGLFTSSIAPTRLAILVTDEPLPSVAAKLGGFDAIFTSLLRTACESLDVPQPLESQLALTAHDVVNGDPATVYPDPDTIDAVFITGSSHSASSNQDWIEGRVRVIGVCFGHQIVARALGARVGRSPHGWELSVVKVGLTEEGKRVFGAGSLKIYQTHRDAVLEYPPGVVPLAHNQVANTGHGHPEFSPFMMGEMLRIRHRAGVIPDGPFENAMARVADKHDGIAIARAFLRFLRE
ncbi:putative glutamine amidotransferase class-I [Chaetomidium leptoderma]|uniref:Glutamine amidotransferase class-I n=1 Tax=Chaetomidium leptoderma TaxID=669021 RepID=A0AAN6VE48_9PEZI|nr:putative glutamine amidotransferase class-I [Chaetomidium leptoderma]